MADTESKKLAVLIDADNAQATICGELLAESPASSWAARHLRAVAMGAGVAVGYDSAEYVVAIGIR